MFGEDDSESPRLASPWEAFSTSPSPCPGLVVASSVESSVSSSDIEAELARRLQCEVPRLVPEVEEGNVEYKLKLSPSPERLTRLITQLKWRLLEGGGQALYEIGVGDDGQLIGLSRREMEGSLDALERMAGELGATVVVLREIVVPKRAMGNGGGGSASGDDEEERGKLAPPAFLGTPQSTSTSGSASSDDLEAFSLELDSGGSPRSTLSSPWGAQTRPTKNKPSNSRRIKLAQKAEHKRIRREVKRNVNAAYTGTSPTNSLLGSIPSALDPSRTAVPPALGVPEVVVEAPILAEDTVVVSFDPSPAIVAVADPDEVIIVEALVVRKLALEEAFLDFGGFSHVAHLVLNHAMPARRISYVIPAPQEPPPQLSLPPPGAPRHGQTTPLLIPTTVDSRDPPRSTPRPSHPQHRLAVSALALDTSTQLVDRSTPEGILYTSGRDGLVAAWELGVNMRRRPPRASERRRHWEALTGWDEGEDESDEDDDDEGGMLRPPRLKRARPPVDESGWAHEDRWEAASDELRPAQFRQSVQLHTDWINDIVLCNMNQTVVSASSDGTLRTYNPHSADLPNILGTHTDYARCLAYASGPRWVASGSFDRTVKLWDISRAAGPSFAASMDYGTELTTLSLGDADPKASIYAVATDPAGTIVAAGGPERVVRVWDPRIPGGAGGGGEPRCVSALRGHTDNVRAILVSEDGRYLWSLPMRRCIHTFSVHADSVWALHSTHPQLHTFFSGDRAGWICRFDVTQPPPSANGEAFSSQRSNARHSIAGTLSQMDKEREMELSDAYCVVIGQAGYENQTANGANGHKHNSETSYGITALTAMDDTWVWAASGDSSVQRWRGVAAVNGMANNWGSRGANALVGRDSTPRVGSSSPQRVGSPPPRVGSPSPKPTSHTSAMAHTNSGAGRKRVSIDLSRHDSIHAHAHNEGEPTLVPIPARVPVSPTALRHSISSLSQLAPAQPQTVSVPYTALVRLAEPNPFQLRPHDPETATLYSHSGVSVHRNVHRDDLALGSGFFGLPPAPGASMYTAPPLNHTSSLPLVSPSPGGGGGIAPPLNHTNSNLPLASPGTHPATNMNPHPSTLPIASDVSTVTPLSLEPADEITGSHGLVRSVVLNDRIHALSVDTRGEVAVWDVVRGVCRGVFVLDLHDDTGHKISPREALDLVRDRIEGEAMTPAWASVDTRVGDLTVHLIEPRCFDAEVYADEIEWLDVRAIETGDENEHRQFTRAELALSAELAAPTPRATAPGLPPAVVAVPGLPSVAEGKATAPEDGINSIPGSPRVASGSPALSPATPLALGGLPLAAPPSPVTSTGIRTPRAAHVSLTGRPNHIPLPTRARSASEASMGGFGLGLGLMTPSGSGLGSATLAPMMSPAILPDDEATAATTLPGLNILSPIRELQGPSVLATLSQLSPGERGPSTTNTVGPGTSPGDYFSSVKLGREREGSTGDPITPGGGGLMGRLKSLGKTGKRASATPGGTAFGGVTGGDVIEAGEAEVEEDKDPERTKHLALLSSLLSSPLLPPQQNEVPPIAFPPNTAITISEATADASGWMAVFAGSTGTLGADVEALEMAIPGWLLEFLLAGRLGVAQGAGAGQKMGFMLLPWKGAKEVLPELIGSQSRLTASRFLRVSKVLMYVRDKLLMADEGPNPPEREYEVLCNEQVLSKGATLAAVRQYVWRNAGELVMHYRVKEA
ncbi:hypothetical protein FRC10_007521 [Ceratobasidium sp. 414]|nr:hypothetical protein FRC10_007521 [Ceratobasidium sp. 414]